MTVSAQVPTNVSTANGSTAVFPYDFRILRAPDLYVEIDGVAQTLNVDYTVSGVGNDGGGNVTFLAGNVANGRRVLRKRQMSLQRTTDFQIGGALRAPEVNKDYDSAVMMLQQIDEQLGRSLHFPPSFTGSGELPQPVALGGLRFNGAGTGLEAYTIGPVSAPEGSDQVGFVQQGANAVARSLQQKVRGSLPVSVEDFGAIGDGITDDYLAIRRAFDAAQARGDGCEVLFEKETYAFGTPLVLTGKPVAGVARGIKFPAYNGNPASIGTTLKYIGSAGQVATKFIDMTGKHGLRGIGIDCNNLAECGLETRNVYYGDYADISIVNQTGVAFRPHGTVAGGGTSWCRFSRFYLEALGNGRVGLHTTGIDDANTCHNIFDTFAINHSGTGIGWKLGYSDNNVFQMIYINRVSGTGAGVLVVPEEEPLYPNFPESNYIYHLQAGAGGWVQPANARLNFIFGYDQSNGQPFPVVPAGSKLFYTYYGGIVLNDEEFLKDKNVWAASSAITVAANSGAITTVGAKSCRYLVRGKTVKFHINVTITTNGSGAGFINIGNLPFNAGGSAGFVHAVTGRALGGGGAIMGTFVQGTNTIAVQLYNGNYPGADGVQLVLSGEVELN